MVLQKIYTQKFNYSSFVIKKVQSLFEFINELKWGENLQKYKK